ncbi:MAG: PAS domain S-box protein [bacterium]
MPHKKHNIKKNEVNLTEQERNVVKRDELLFYRYIVENLQSKITVLDKDGFIRYQNRAYNSDDFYPPEEVIGKKFTEFVHPEHLKEITEVFAYLISHPGAVRELQSLFRYKDGSWHLLDIRAKSMLDVPEVDGIIVNSRDITEYKNIENELNRRSTQLEQEIENRKRAEEALKRSEQFFKTIVQNSYDSIVIIDEHGNRKYASSSFSNVGGYNPEEMLGKNVFDLVHPADKETVLSAYKKLLSDPGRSYSVQARYLARDGNYIWVEVSATNMLNNPIVNGIVLDTRDITARKNIEEELKRSEERFRTIIQNSTDVITIVDEKGISQYISPSFETVTGYKIQERLNKNALELLHPEDLPKVIKTFNHIINKPNVIYNGEARYLHKDGTYHWFEISAVNLIHDPNIKGVVLTYRDISQRKLSEQRLREEMEITSELLALSEAISTITDINKLMMEAVKASKRITGSNITMSYLLDARQDEFVPAEQVDLPKELLPLFKTETLKLKHLNRFLDLRKPFLVKFFHSEINNNLFLPIVDVKQEEVTWFSILDYIGIQEINTLIIIPLLKRDEWLGVIIGVYFKKGYNPSRFTQRYYNAIIGIANQVSVALEQAKLYMESVEKTMELSHRVEVINTMYEIDRSILSNLTSIDVLDTVIRMANKAIPSDVSDIMLFDKDKTGFNIVKGSSRIFPSFGAFLSINDTSASEVVKTGRPQYIHNLGEVKKLLPYEWGLLHNGFMSVMRIPLTIGDDIIGILSFYSKRVSAFNHEDLLTGEKLGSQISVALANIRLINDLEESSLSIIKSLSKAIDAKSKWTAGHSAGVARYAIAIGKAMGFDEKSLKDLEVASLLHDVGKIATYSDILDKNGSLSESEWALVKQHPDQGVEIINPIKQLKHIIPIIRHHHEFYDGSGYPAGLKGEQIPKLARVLSVADAIDAMRSDRPYRKGKTKKEIMDELRRFSGSQFDPEIVEVVLSIEGILDQ